MPRKSATKNGKASVDVFKSTRKAAALAEEIIANGGKLPAKKRRGPPEEFLFKPGNPWAWQKGHSGNPGGQPKLISQAYKDFLEHVDEDGVSNAAKVALGQGFRAIVNMDTAAAQEMRRAVEGDTINFAVLDDEKLRSKILELQERIDVLLGAPQAQIEEPHDDTVA